MKKTKNTTFFKTFFTTVFANVFFLTACFSQVPANLPLNFVQLNQVLDLDNSFGETAVDPRTYEKKYLKLIQEDFDADPNNKIEFIKHIKSTNFFIQDHEIEQAIQDAHLAKAIDYAHYQYSNERSMSLYFDYVSPDGDLNGKYGTGWFVDRLKNADGTWSNDFIISTNVHVIDQVKKPTNIFGDTTGGYPNKVINLNIAKLPFDWQTINSQPQYLMRNNYHSIKGWEGDASFGPNNRLLLSTLENLNIDNNLKYFLDFGSFSLNTSIVQILWDEVRSKISFGTQASNFLSDISQYLAFYGYGEFLAKDVDPTFDQLNFFSSRLLEANENLDISAYVNEQSGIFQKAEDLLEKRKSQKTNLDQAFIKLTIDDETLNNLFPILANPEKYNEWTFPKISSGEQFQFSYDYQTDSFYGFSNARREYKLLDEEKYKIWHAGYPVEQRNRDLNYRATGPAFKYQNGDVFSYHITINDAATTKVNLDYNDCKIYSEFCKDDYVQPGGFNIRVKSDNITGGGSSGSLALDKDYNAIGIYWGEQSNNEKGIQFETLGLYAPFKISNFSSEANIFEPLINASTGIIPYQKNHVSEKLLKAYLTNLFRLQYHNYFNFSFYQDHMDQFDNIDFTSEETISRDVGLIFSQIAAKQIGINLANLPINDILANINLPSDITLPIDISLPTTINNLVTLKNPRNLSTSERLNMLLRHLKPFTKTQYDETEKVDNQIGEILEQISSLFLDYSFILNYKITPFYQRQLGEVDVQKQLKQYLVNHSINTYLHNH